MLPLPNILSHNRDMYKHITTIQYLEIVKKISTFIILLIAQFCSFVHDKLIISRRCFYRDSEVTHSFDDFPHCKSNVKTIEEVKIRYECIMHPDKSNCIGRQITSGQSNSAGCGMPTFSMMPVLIATCVPLPKKAFPLRLSVRLLFYKSYVARHPRSVIIQVGIMVFLNISTLDYVTTIEPVWKRCILPLWYYELASMLTKIASTQSELPLSPSQHHVFTCRRLLPFPTWFPVHHRAVPEVEVKAIHSGPQFRVAYGKKIMFSCLDLYVQKCRELGSGVQPQATPQA
ncbi:hypothetical protein T10_5052 [Trichinella papuae]|uniref:Uncharacterized protein n=1 Tax=Trichinella papuae TaxID=268474 RepID=A0A0V1MGL7_9BILA|nr:hypothetical protein T10_5052 [Trichinella papuae]